MRHRLVASAFAATLLASPALAAPTPEGASGRPQRTVTATGVTKPPTASARPTKAATDAEMLKAQRASAARDKAWDSRTRASMGSICKGC